MMTDSAPPLQAESLEPQENEAEEKTEDLSAEQQLQADKDRLQSLLSEFEEESSEQVRPPHWIERLSHSAR